MSKEEKVREILEESVGFPPDNVPEWVDFDEAIRQICQLFTPKPDTKRLLTDEDIIIAICGDCPFQNRFGDEDCHSCQRNMRESAQSQLAKDQQEEIDATNDYANGKISFERWSERLGVNFYELKDACSLNCQQYFESEKRRIKKELEKYKQTNTDRNLCFIFSPEEYDELWEGELK